MIRNKPSNPQYDDFYSKSGWKYSKRKEKKRLKKKIIEPLKLRKGTKVLEIGCGMGLCSYLFSKLGFEVVGVDISEGGINYAKKHYSGPRYLHLDANDLLSEYEPERFDIIYASGMSWYHYGLNGIGRYSDVDVPIHTRDLFKLLKKEGLFILRIVTDFSGRRPTNKIHQNELKDYVGLFERFGEIIYISDLDGNILRSETDARESKNGIIIATRK